MSQGIRTPYPDLADRESLRGRPTLCTSTIITATANIIAHGGYPTVALEQLGISGGNHSVWIDKATRDHEAGLTDTESCYIEYAKAIKIAAATWENHLISQVALAADAGPQYWPAGMTALERRHPDRWGKRERQEPLSYNTTVQIAFVPAASSVGSAAQVIVNGQVRQALPAPQEEPDQDVIDVPAREVEPVHHVKTTPPLSPPPETLVKPLPRGYRESRRRFPPRVRKQPAFPPQANKDP